MEGHFHEFTWFILLLLLIYFFSLIVTLTLIHDGLPKCLLSRVCCVSLLALCLKMQSYAYVHMDMHGQRAQDGEQCETVM